MLMIDALLAPEKPVSQSLLRRCLGYIVALEAAIPPPEVDAPENPAEPTRGHLFAEAPAIVMAVQDRMARWPHLFPTGSAASLLSGQVRAFSWAVIADGLQVLTDRARGHHRREQAAVTRHALRLLRRAREAVRLPHASDEDRDRAYALSLPECLVDLWNERKFGRRR